MSSSSSSSSSYLFPHSLAIFSQECRLQAKNLRQGKCQLCIDGLLLLLRVPQKIVNHQQEQDDEIITPSNKCPLASCGDDFILSLARECPCIKIVYPSNKSFRGLIDVSLFESCQALELIRIPFHQLVGTEKLRQNLRSLIWIRGNYESLSESTYSLWQLYRQHESIDSKRDNFKPFRIDELFWDKFGSWPSLTYLCISRSNITVMNASTIPNSIVTLDLRCNRISHFNNLANYSSSGTITKLCLDYNSLRELPKLNSNTLSSLVYLSLRGNLIDSIFGLRNFTSLDYLDVSENSITNTRKFLSEMVYLSSTLKTLWIEKNPICCDHWIKSKCQSVLCRLVRFNGKRVSRNKTSETLQPLPVISNIVDQTIRLSNDYAADQLSNTTNQNANIRKMKRSKPSKERFIVISDDDEDEAIEAFNSLTDVSPIILSSTSVTRNEKRNETAIKNYFFGGYTGSYSSIPNRNESSSKLFEVYVEQEEQLEDDSEKTIVDKPNETIENMAKKSISPEPHQFLNSTSEWASEDTEEENTVFLVEIYQSLSEFESILETPNPDIDYYFIRIRPHDGLIYEKDCTSGKVLQTLDLKVLEKYECLNVNTAIKLYFDTCVVSKKERIYRFLDEKSYKNFVEMFLSKLIDYRKQYQSSFGNKDGGGIDQAKTSGNKKTADAPWFYMCLRCGNRTHRIITDCTKCGSDLIIKDESSAYKDVQLQSLLVDYPQQNTSIRNDSSDLNDNNDLLKLDENFFRYNIDHYLKLHIEIYLYEKIGDESLKSESVEVLFYCYCFDFQQNSFKPALAVLTSNFFFLFDHLAVQQSIPNKEIPLKEPLSLRKNLSSSSFRSTSEEKKHDLICLIFYVPLAPRSKRLSSLHICHLPWPIKNLGYWIEYKLSNSQKKLLAKNKRINRQQPNYLLEFIIFGDDTVGKAFLELLFEFQKICIRNHSKSDLVGNMNGLIKVKNKLIENNDKDDNVDCLKVDFDETCRSLLHHGEPQPSQAFQNDDIKNDRSYRMFFLQSFRFLQNASTSTITASSSSPSSFNNVFTINENIGLIIANDHLIIFEMFCSLPKIASTIKKASSNEQSISKTLKDQCKKDFNDHIEIKTLFKESINNLLPNIYVDKSKSLLVMRFREDDESTATICLPPSLANNKTASLSSSTLTNNNQLIIYEYKLTFLNQQSLIQTCRLICSAWETNFGVALTLSKYRFNDELN
ncbi:uncharacterized protein LOC124495284 [Dermatophagoides farinae]|uniref:uncharacterized protein LOC124495284 n=1 Tax=Dermatophagoides farinae TaxID=6954 RepID=UPI003F627214